MTDDDIWESDAVRGLQDDLVEAVAQVEELLRYVAHDQSCSKADEGTAYMFPEEDCSCGLDKLLARVV